MKRWAVAALVLVAAACATAPPPQPRPSDILEGTASWYGQEFAGRTTANGEIFDPMQLTAAHRTLPFGTICDVTNPKTGKTVRVRINDRGPYISGRMIDLSYAAAKQIGLVEPGSGQVDVTVVKLGGGEYEAPAPMVVTVPDVKVVPDASPAAVTAAAPPENIPVVVDNVQVRTEHHDVETRLQVSADGRKIEEVPVKPAPPQPSTPGPAPTLGPSAAKFVVQVGAFAEEANAKELLTHLTKIGQTAYIEPGSLFRVRIGPFATRELAMEARTRLETAGISAIIVAQ